MEITTIVLTGGPCAGKTSALPRVRAAFEALGYVVLTVPETATTLIQGGISPEKCGGLAFQRSRLRLQLETERAFDRAARSMGAEKALIVCDRGMLDSLSYLSRADFEALLAELGTDEIEQRDKYGAVFHMVSAARDAREAYTLATNAARGESPEAALALDQRLIAAWTGHNHLRFIPNFPDFEDKLARLIAEIAAFLGEPEPLEIERKYLIEYPDLARLEALPNCRMVEIEQAYLARADGVTDRARKRGSEGHYSYYHTEKRRITLLKRVEVETRVTRERYEALLAQADPTAQIIRKRRYCLSENDRYYEIDVFPEWSDKAFLELELRDESEPVVLPEHIRVIREVTEDPRYTNYALARSGMRPEG